MMPLHNADTIFAEISKKQPNSIPPRREYANTCESIKSHTPKQKPTPAPPPRAPTPKPSNKNPKSKLGNQKLEIPSPLAPHHSSPASHSLATPPRRGYLMG